MKKLFTLTKIPYQKSSRGEIIIFQRKRGIRVRLEERITHVQTRILTPDRISPVLALLEQLQAIELKGYLNRAQNVYNTASFSFIYDKYAILRLHRHRILLVLFIIASFFVGLGVVNSFSSNAVAQNVSPTPSPVPPTPTPTPYVGIPVKLEIPKLTIAAPIETVDYDKDEKIGVPSNFTNVAWFDKSQKPGAWGNAFIDGHYDTTTGGPAVFYYLSKLTAGDQVIVYDDKGVKYVFVVTDVRDFPLAEIPMERIFTPVGKQQLFLLTCHGFFNHAIGTYSHRTIVTAEIQSIEQPSPTPLVK